MVEIRKCANTLLIILALPIIKTEGEEKRRSERGGKKSKCQVTAAAELVLGLQRIAFTMNY